MLPIPWSGKNSTKSRARRLSRLAQPRHSARVEAKESYLEGRKLAEFANDPNETPIQYDLYRMPFNGGKGGRSRSPVRRRTA